jgi:sugar phosphate isomerase/epimerase
MREKKEYLSGFGDEASPRLEKQIEAHKLLGWDSIELRSVEGENLCEMSDAKFDQVRALMEENGMRAACFGSAIANWARPISTPFSKDVEDLHRAIPRMRALDTKLIRIMSYPNDGLSEDDWKKEVFLRMRELISIAEGEGIILLHENCDGWGSVSPYNLGHLMKSLESPAFKIVFDTGNPISHKGTKEETWAFYQEALPYIAHFHIKDCRLVNGEVEHMYPGMGDSDVFPIIQDLVSRGYEGMFSIEPHIHVQAHKGEHATVDDEQFKMYVKYGIMANELFDALKY